MYLTEKCTKCDSTFTTEDLAGNFVYELVNGLTAPINTTSGWCYHCDTLRPIEDLDPNAQDKRLSELSLQINQPVGFLKSFSEKHKAQNREHLQELRALELLKQALLSREIDPKCLYCGSVDIKVIERARQSCYRPGCSGRLVQDDDPIFAYMEYPLQVYNLNGDLIRSEDS